jgi:endonuclease YncB( thermonuclease family)
MLTCIGMNETRCGYLGLFFGLLLLACACRAETFTGHVVGVSDGDTITVLEASKRQHKVRLIGIDAPERKQPFGNRSKQHLSYLVYDKPVSVEWTKHDRYGRIVGKVMVAAPDACPPLQQDCPKTLDTGLAQITVGLARHYKQYEKEQTEESRERYSFAEDEAREKHAGL